MTRFCCEDGDEIVKNVSNLLLEGKTEPKYHEISRGDEVELAAVKRILDISEKVDYPVYIVHLSTKKALDEIIRRRKSGVKVIVETCPQYLLLFLMLLLFHNPLLEEYPYMPYTS